MTQILLERIPEDIKQRVCVDWLIKCVCGGVCGVEVITLILKYIKLVDEVKNVIIGLLINTWEFRNEKAIFLALTAKVPDNELGPCLIKDFDGESFLVEVEYYLYKSDGSILNVALSSGADKYFESCLSSAQQSAI